MSIEVVQKVTASYLKRSAFLYIRQSTPRQVLENTESKQRQYALRQRAEVLGWGPEQVIVIDSDLGQSGASAADREGFQKLVTEVSTDRAGIVMGLEVSCLARNSADWHLRHGHGHHRGRNSRRDCAGGGRAAGKRAGSPAQGD